MEDAFPHRCYTVPPFHSKQSGPAFSPTFGPLSAKDYLMISAVGDTPYNELRSELAANPRTWLITGVAGFIGSNLLEELLSLGQNVVGLDNFSTGYQANIDDVLASPAGKKG